MSTQISPHDPATAPPSPPRSLWKRLTTGRFLVVSILFHVLLVTVAVYLVVQIAAPPRKSFQAPPGAPNQQQKAVEHQVSMAKKTKTMSAPAAVKRITTSAISKVALPEMPDMPKTDEVPVGMVGTSPGALGSGVGGSGSGSSSGGGLPFFGLRDSGVGLEGSFSDFKKDPAGSATGFTSEQYTTFVKRFTSSPTWAISSRFKHKDSSAKLYSKFFFFPSIQDREAGGAFQAPDAGPGFWIAHYKGSFAAPEDGTYRLVGFGDNVLLASIDGKLALDASDKGYTGRHRELLGEVKLPPKPGVTPVFAGQWFTVTRNKVVPIQVALGDEGGIFCAGLFLQKKDQPYKANGDGLPQLPLVFIGAPTDSEKAMLSKYLPAESLAGPYFKSVKDGQSGAFRLPR